jgi:membrane-bound lytic murein transglycosylase MltF
MTSERQLGFPLRLRRIPGLLIHTWSFPALILRDPSNCQRFRAAGFNQESLQGADLPPLDVHIQYALSSQEIADQIEAGNASYVAVVSCRDTYFRKVLPSQDRTVDISFDPGILRGEVAVDSYVVWECQTRDTRGLMRRLEKFLRAPD